MNKPSAPLHAMTPATTPAQQRKSNVRLGLILASVALVVFVGFMVKSALLGI